MNDLTPNDLSHLSDEEFIALCPQGEHAPGAKPLSPAARAVFETFNSKFEWIEDGVPGPQFHAIAAAIRALVDQVVPEAANAVGDDHDDARLLQWMRIRLQLLTIATELEG